MVWMMLGPSAAMENDPGGRQLLDKDREFSEFSRREGLCPAFLAFLDREGIVLPRQGHLVTGRPDFKLICRRKQGQFEDLVMGWIPEMAKLSASGKLGVTRGRYTGVGPGTGHKPETGIYASVWHKNARGNWKILFSQGLYPRTFACHPPDLRLEVAREAAGRSLVAAELAFARHALDHGVARAFYQFIAREGVAVSAGRIQTRSDYHRQIVSSPENEPEQLLEWKPVVSRVSASGDLGYNAGPYRYTLYPDTGGSRVYYGYFFTVWIRENGSWKFLYDAGNRVSGEVSLD